MEGRDRAGAEAWGFPHREGIAFGVRQAEAVGGSGQTYGERPESPSELSPSSRPILSRAASLFSGAGAGRRCGFWFMTARDFGWRRSGYQKGVFAGGRRAVGPGTWRGRWKRINCKSCWRRAIRRRRRRRPCGGGWVPRAEKIAWVLRSSPVSATLRRMEGTFRYRSQEITTSQVEFIRQLVAEHPEATRRRLSLLLCEAWGWKQPNGAPRDMVCRGLLLSLHRAGP